MALNSNLAFQQFKEKVKNDLGIDLDDAVQKSMFEIMIETLILHIQTNAVVKTNVAVQSVTGVTTGAGVSGPGTGTGTGRIQ